MIEQSLRFAFKARNNQEKYKALLVGMNLANEMIVKMLAVRSDSQLVIRKVTKSYQVQDPQLGHYSKTFCNHGCCHKCCI